ncbi:MAG: HD domain-containing protein [Acidobacteria bacterium]|nr:HD domain-containing protein [Acidobacteriota bacterium]
MILEAERYALRLGRHVFFDHQFDAPTITKAVKAFKHFRSLMDLYDVQTYRAVATSATREARNQRQFIDEIYKASRIRLEVIDPAEEARLVRCAVKASAAGKLSPRWIADLGGGSLEISRLQSGVLQESIALPFGTVRIMETFGISDVIAPEQIQLLRSYARSLLRRFLQRRDARQNDFAVTCGGNAEALALIANATSHGRMKTVDAETLRHLSRSLCALTIKERMRTFHIRKDRAEVIGIAAVILETVAQALGWQKLLVPGVGVREGILADLVRSLSKTNRARQARAHAEYLRESARRFAAKLMPDNRHAEKVAELAVSIFDQLQPVHKLGSHSRLTLELAALLHDLGHAVDLRSQERHSEYLVRHGDIPGLEPSRRNIMAHLIRWHGDADGLPSARTMQALSRKQQQHVQILLAVLRIAGALDWDRTQAVTRVRIRCNRKLARFDVRARRDCSVNLWTAQRRAVLFETVFDRKTSFVQVR